MAVVAKSFGCQPSSSSCSVSVLPSSKKPSTTSLVSVSRFPFKSVDLLSKSLTGLSFHTPTITTMRKASIEVKDGGESVSESDDEDNLLFDKLPLDPKLQQKLEHKMKMKLAKKIRLRSKKLVRQRRMRKKGRFPKITS